MAYESKLTDDQMKVVEEVGDRLERAFDDARQQLRAARIRDDDDDWGTRCLVCRCPSYVFPRSSSRHVCDRSGCGHSFMRHDVW